MSCPTCGTELEPGAARCTQCGKVLGEANRCPHCAAVAGLEEVLPDRYRCMACGKNRASKVGTVVLRSYAETLESSAQRRYWTAWLLLLSGVLLAGAAWVAAVALWWVLDRALAGQLAAAVGFVLLGLHLWAARQLRRQVAELRAAALERRLVQEVRSYSTGVTPERAAAALQQDLDQVDQLLTGLAKRGRLELDVLDDGNLRYRVPQGSLAPPPPSAEGADEDLEASR